MSQSGWTGTNFRRCTLEPPVMRIMMVWPRGMVKVRVLAEACGSFADLKSNPGPKRSEIEFILSPNLERTEAKNASGSLGSIRFPRANDKPYRSPKTSRITRTIFTDDIECPAYFGIALSEFMNARLFARPASVRARL